MSQTAPFNAITIEQNKIDTLIEIAKSNIVNNRYEPFTIQSLLKDKINDCERINDPRRKAITTMTMGRIAYSQGKYKDALALHKEALKIWNFECSDKDRDMQYVDENYIYMLKAIVADNSYNEHRNFIVDKCTASDNCDINLRAKFINSGKKGNIFDTILQSIFIAFSCD